MKIRKILVPTMLVLFVAAGAVAVSAQDWRKIGEKRVSLKLDRDTVHVGGKGPVREIHIKVMYAPVKFKRVVINYKDGATKDLEYLENVQVGQASPSITIEGDGHVIRSIDFWYDTDSLGGKRAKVTVYGHS